MEQHNEDIGTKEDLARHRLQMARIFKRRYT